MEMISAKHSLRLRIIARVLTSSAQGKGVTETEIRYVASLSHAKAKDYLSVLLDTGLLEYDDEIRRYRATDKGIHFLTDYKKKLNESSRSSLNLD
jgi:predicted transcriptional regulator